MEALTQFVGLILALRTTFARDHDSGRGHPGEAGEPQKPPAHPHQLRRVVA
jgi:hypothetical protein